MLKTFPIDSLLEDARTRGQCPYSLVIREFAENCRGVEDYTTVDLIQLLHSHRIETVPADDALYWAVHWEDSAATHELIRLGLCDPVTSRDHFDSTIMHAATYASRFEWIKKVYLMAPCLMNAKDSSGDTPLDNAIQNHNVACARFLFEHGAPVSRDPNDESIMSAVFYNFDDNNAPDEEISKLVFAYGGRPDLAGYTDLSVRHRVFLANLYSRLRSCGSAALVVMGLNCVGCNTQGNGRDALRLIARMVWVYRVDEVWGDYDDQVDGGESPQKKMSM